MGKPNPVSQGAALREKNCSTTKQKHSPERLYLNFYFGKKKTHRNHTIKVIQTLAAGGVS